MFYNLLISSIHSNKSGIKLVDFLETIRIKVQSIKTDSQLNVSTFDTHNSKAT